MKTDVASTVPPLASRLPPDGKPGTLLADRLDIPDDATRHTADSRIEAAPVQDMDLARDLALFLRVLWTAEGRQRGVAIFVALVAATIANMFNGKD